MKETSKQMNKQEKKQKQMKIQRSTQNDVEIIESKCWQSKGNEKMKTNPTKNE